MSTSRLHRHITVMAVFCLLQTIPVSKGLCKTPRIMIRGNYAIIDEVYLAVIDLPKGAKANQSTANLIQQQLLRFLHRSGYVLARVKARPERGKIFINIDEGRLEKVVFLGSGSLKTLRLKLDFNLPHHIYNRPYLVRQLQLLKKNHGFQKISYRLKPFQQMDHNGIQFEQLGSIQGHEIIPPQGRYELHIRLGNRSWGTGYGIDMEYDFPDGLIGGVQYKGEKLFISEDRFWIGARLGAKIRKKLISGDSYLTISRVTGELRWYTPVLIGDSFRPFLWLESDLASRQRGDLMVEIYYRERIAASVNLSHEPLSGFSVSLGGGAWARMIFGIEQLEGTDTQVDESFHFEPFVAARTELNFDPEILRKDRHHELTLEARHYWVQNRPSFSRANLDYQKIFSLGWHDVWLRLRGTYIWGEVFFDDEQHVGGRYLRGVFGHIYTDRVAGMMLELRLSLARDLFKVSLFHDLAGFNHLHRSAEEGDHLHFGNSFGIGFHALILDTFQLDIYYALGFASDENLNHGLSTSLKKVF